MAEMEMLQCAICYEVTQVTVRVTTQATSSISIFSGQMNANCFLHDKNKIQSQCPHKVQVQVCGYNKKASAVGQKWRGKFLLVSSTCRGSHLKEKLQRNFYEKLTFLFICLQPIMVLTSVHAQPVTWLTGTVELEVIQRRLWDYNRANLFLYRIKALCNGVIFMIFCASSRISQDELWHGLLHFHSQCAGMPGFTCDVQRCSIFHWYSVISTNHCTHTLIHLLTLCTNVVTETAVRV